MHGRAGKGMRLRAGVSLIEIAVVVVVLGVLAAVAVPNINEWSRHQRLRSAARDLNDLLLLARSDAIRTGRRQIVYFGRPGATDPGGGAIQRNGSWVPVLRTDDGVATASNCKIEAGEAREVVAPVDGISWGVSVATGRVPTDGGYGPFNPALWDGGTFGSAVGIGVHWVMFGPDGVPVTFNGGGGVCGVVGGLGSGGGGLYLTDGERDYAVVVSPIGSVRVHHWDPGAGAWSS
jgi:prepilin-type N-terminal cleavage/methylation domain-containing protein